MKKILLVSLLTSSMFLNTACTEDEVALGIIGAVGIGIGVAIATSDSDNDEYRDGYRDGRRDDRRDDHRRGHHDRGRGHGGHRRYALITGSQSSFGTVAADSKLADFSQKYHISTTAAAKIQNAFANGQKEGTKAFAAIGLTQNDLRTIASRSLPGNDSIAAMAQTLDLPESKAKVLLQDLIQEFSAQAADVNSNYWQSCKAKGSWKTPQNASCQKESWEGCSPATGASLCF